MPVNRSRSARELMAALLAAAASLCVASAARAQSKPSTVSGVVIDSIRGSLLVGGIVQLHPAGREALISDSGRFLFRDVAPGKYTLRVLHAMLDTLGLAVVTPEFVVDST